MTKPQTKKFKLSAIKPAEYNPRVTLTPDDPEFQQLAASISVHGFVTPPVVNKNGTLIAGHQRIAVAEHLGIKEVECVVVDLDENRERALNIALNKIEGRWDNERLLQLVDELAGDDVDLSTLGFTDEGYDELLRKVDQLHAADFLTDLFDADADIKASADDIDVGAHTPDEFKVSWYSMSFVVSGPERETVMKGLRSAQDFFGVDTSPKALVRVAEEYLKKNEIEEDHHEA